MKIHRDLKKRLENHLEQKEISLLIGARQVGKTTLLKEIADELRRDGQQVVFFNLDIESDFAHFESQERLLQRIKLTTGGRKAVVFIDEIQRKTNAGLFLKGLYDMDLPYKFVVSGSGSLELKEKIHESLAGRKRIFELYPVSIKEFLDFRTDYKYAGQLSEWCELEPLKAEQVLIEYLNFGGYPRVITAEEADEKTLILQEIFQSYLEKDLKFLLGIEKTSAYTLLIRLLANRTGQPVSYSNLSRETGLSLPTLKKYLWYAQKTFIVELLTPFFRNPEKELIKAPEVYFNDLGFRNFSLQKLGKFQAFAEMGFVFENFVFQILREKFSMANQPMKYWRTKGKAEMDFVIERGLSPLPVEVKARALKRPEIQQSFRIFLKDYSPEEAWVVNLSLDAEIKVENTTVRFLPWYKLI